MACRNRACTGNTSVLLLATGTDGILRTMAVDRVLSVEEQRVLLQQQLPLPAPEVQTVGD